ncbi:hypothetical protein AJ80_01453 [Polytolypa hystricis UAMH7299]|uniref:pyridoxal 5'-phosphate synthase n=1 Tax=Polytolypa hystricis (strain UAMH7299) TaxID=1447883 RepID=A0A2B7Z0M4_POLH7|nr:hypothetical protein AJ80_01453 [Polytolypa hystricis UAMH7299]
MTLDQAEAGVENAGAAAPKPPRHPKRLIFAPGDIAASPALSTSTTTAQSLIHPTPIPAHILNTSSSDPDLIRSNTSTPTANILALSHPSRAHQFTTNPPFTLAQLNLSNPFHQFHSWFRDGRLPATSAPETCVLATARMPLGRVSARVVYLKELDERGWVVYSNWGSREGKGAQVFGAEGGEEDFSGFVAASDEVGQGDGRAQQQHQQQHQGNKWAALTFNWANVERQVRVEGLVEPLSREESETYWRTRERGSQIGAWASQQSKVLWSMEPQQQSAGVAETDAIDDDVDDGRSTLDDRVREMEARFADVQDIPLPPFWGGVRIVPESVEFWQGRKSRLHDRFRYVRVHSGEASGELNEKTFKWRIQRLAP